MPLDKVDLHDLPVEYDYNLRRPFDYSKGGEQYTANFIRLTAPTARHSRQCAALKQAFDRTAKAYQDQAQAEIRLSGLEDDDEKDDTPDLTAAMVVTMLSASPVVDYADVLDVAVDLFTRDGVALIDGETKLTRHLTQKLDFEDLENLLGEFVVHFTLASRQAQTKDESEKES